MIDIPFGKALVPMPPEEKDQEGFVTCTGCVFHKKVNCEKLSAILACTSMWREDNKHVIFKLVDFNNNSGTSRKEDT